MVLELCIQLLEYLDKHPARGLNFAVAEAVERFFVELEKRLVWLDPGAVRHARGFFVAPPVVP